MLLRGVSFLALFLTACDWGRQNGDGGHQPAQGGMRLIAAAGKAFAQGSRKEGAPPEERPAFDCRFDYDFHMDTVEVTQGEYAELMGSAPAKDEFGKGRDFPVYGISWYEAVLYCNARSKAEGRDTVYDYVSVSRTRGGSVYDLPGLVVRLERSGYRLPTEAEWEFAAASGNGSGFPWGASGDSTLAAAHAWFSVNADGTTHAVGKLEPNGCGIYDMAGNVMEWVNDWKGSYPEEPMVDFAGSRDPGPLGETPVKGGSFHDGISALRISNRSATYATIRSAAAEYVGFRCVLGAIPRAAYTLTDGAASVTDPVRLELTRLASAVGGRRAKLVFVNAAQEVRHLAYVDYARLPVRVREFGDVSDVFHPAVSPDGEWVAYGTAPEGAVSGSEIHLRSIGGQDGPPVGLGSGFIPRWWVDPATRDTFLVYSTSGMDDMQPAWEDGKTLMRKIAGGAPVGEARILTDGAFHDGRSRDGRWLATGFRRLMNRDGISGEVRTLFTGPGNGKEPGDTSQVCNVSIAPDSSGRLLFLDFGYDGKSALTGSWYDIHAVAFLSDPGGTILKTYAAPRGEKAWDDLEWSNVSRYAVAAATSPSDGHGNLYLLDLEDSISTLLASGTYLSTPSLWLGEGSATYDSGLASDSLGRYNEPATDAYQAAFSHKMSLFWRRHRNLELILTGSSHVFTGIDPTRFRGLSVLNASYPAAGWLGQEEWVRGYALPHCPRLKVLIVEAFPGWMDYPDGDFTWKSQTSRTLGVLYDASHGFWKDGLPAGFEAMAAGAPAGASPAIDSLGTVPLPSAGWGDVVLPKDKTWRFDNPDCQAVLGRMENFAADISSLGIHLVLVVHPMHPGFKSTPFYGPYGPTTEVAGSILDSLQGMARRFPRVHFYDAHDFGNHDYDDADANNAGHLGSRGAAKLGHRLDSLVQVILR